ncbi:MAG: heavy-metal-associated domain-containing protein [Eubacterium sp.]
MGTYIVIGILVICVIFAIVNSRKHFKGEGGCCGGGSEIKVKKQHIKEVLETKEILIEGMTCDNCRKRIENRLNSLNQVNAKVKLKEKKAIVKLGEAKSDELLKSTVESMGYKVVSVKSIN